MGLIQTQALISTPKKHIEHGLHHTSESRQEKSHAITHTCANLFPPRPKLCIKVESVSVFFDRTKVADFRWQNSRDVSHDLYIFLSSLGKVYLCQVSSLLDMCDRY